MTKEDIEFWAVAFRLAFMEIFEPLEDYCPLKTFSLVEAGGTLADSFRKTLPSCAANVNESGVCPCGKLFTNAELGGSVRFDGRMLPAPREVVEGASVEMYYGRGG